MSEKIKTVIFSPTARTTRLKAIRFILEKWSVSVAIDFDNKVEELIDQIKNNNKLCPQSKLSNVRKCVVSKQTSMIYQINKDNIEIIAFIDNRAEHDF